MLKIGTKLVCLKDKCWSDCIFYVKEYKSEYNGTPIIVFGIDKYKQNFHSYSVDTFEDLLKSGYFAIYYPNRLELIVD